MMKCKFDESHGDFPNPVDLGKHYMSDHPGKHKPKRSVQKGSPNIFSCKYCDKEFSWPADIRKHVMRHHHDMVRGIYQTTDHATKRRRGSTELVPIRPHKAVQPSKPVLHVDDIVINVVAAMASPSEMIEIHKLPAILAWRDATAVMLEATK